MRNSPVNRQLLQQELQRAQNISRRATAGSGFDPRGGYGVLAAQLATAGIGAYAQNKAKKQLAEQEALSQQQFAAANPELAGVAGQLSPEAREKISLQKALLQTEKQFAAPKEVLPLSPEGKLTLDIQRGFVTEKQIQESKKAKEKPLSSDAAKTLSNATEGIKSINQLNELLGETGGVITTRAELAPERFKTPTGRQITTLRKNIIDIIGRFRSGGAINEDELKTFRSFVPTRTDDAETVQFKLRKLGNQFNNIQKGITGEGIEYAELQLDQKPKEAQNTQIAGTSNINREDALAELRRRKVIE